MRTTNLDTLAIDIFAAVAACGWAPVLETLEETAVHRGDTYLAYGLSILAAAIDDDPDPDPPPPAKAGRLPPGRASPP